MKFIVFLKGTLGKMVATGVLEKELINLDFWETWPRKFYNLKSYDMTKDEFEDDLETHGLFGNEAFQNDPPTQLNDTQDTQDSSQADSPSILTQQPLIRQESARPKPRPPPLRPGSEMTVMALVYIFFISIYNTFPVVEAFFSAQSSSHRV